MEDFDKFEEELLQKYVYGRLTKLVALVGFLIGMGFIFIAHP